MREKDIIKLYNHGNSIYGVVFDEDDTYLYYRTTDSFVLRSFILEDISVDLICSGNKFSTMDKSMDYAKVLTALNKWRKET